MRWLDCLLAAVAVGLSLFTTYTLASGQVETYTSPQAPARFGFTSIVIHESDSCPNLKLGGIIPYHFVITEDGKAVPTLHWERQEAAPHTSNPQALGIVIEVTPYARRDRQSVALRKLVSDLSSRLRIPSRKILVHASVEACACGKKLESK